MIESWPGMYEALGSISNAEKNNNKNQKGKDVEAESCQVRDICEALSFCVLKTTMNKQTKSKGSIYSK